MKYINKFRNKCFIKGIREVSEEWILRVQLNIVPQRKKKETQVFNLEKKRTFFLYFFS